MDIDRADALAVFDRQDSGCVSFGIMRDGQRRFVKTATTEVACASLGRAIEFHRAVLHETIVRPLEVSDDADRVAVDLYDGCFLYDFEERVMRLIDLDEYRPGPFIVEADRLRDRRATWHSRRGHAARPSMNAPRSSTSDARSSNSSIAFRRLVLW